jgi:hypothetical protein
MEQLIKTLPFVQSDTQNNTQVKEACICVACLSFFPAVYLIGSWLTQL